MNGPPPPDPLPPAPAGPRATWSVLEAIPVFLAAIVATAIASAVVAGLGVDEDTALVLVSGVFQLGLAGAVLGWLRILHRPALAALGPPERPRRELLAGVAGGLLTRLVAVFGAGPIVVLLVRALTSEGPRVPDQVPTGLDVAPTLLLGFVAVVLAPLGEELFFRGFLFRALRERRGFWTAAAVSALAFGAVHYVDGSWFYVPIMFVVGLCFAYVYERQGRILSAVAAHATFNLVGVLFLTFA